MDKKYLFYALFSIVVALILGDIWVIHSQMQTLSKNVVEEKKTKSDNSIKESANSKVEKADIPSAK